MICYKVVTVYKYRYYSYCEDNPWRLEYRMGEKTVPRIGKIFAFSSYDGALSFLYSEGYSKESISFDYATAAIIKGIGKEYKNNKLKQILFFSSSLIQDFWNAIINDTEIPNPDWYYYTNIPNGTVFLDYFTPKELILGTFCRVTM